MINNRWSTRLISAALLVMAALVIFQGIATAQVASAPMHPGAAAYATGPAASTCGGWADVHALRAIYRKDAGIWVAQNGRHPAGIDGGVLSWLSCQRLPAGVAVERGQ